jgi:membrane protein involved in colicin uptake
MAAKEKAEADDLDDALAEEEDREELACKGNRVGQRGHSGAGSGQRGSGNGERGEGRGERGEGLYKQGKRRERLYKQTALRDEGCKVKSYVLG